MLDLETLLVKLRKQGKDDSRVEVKECAKGLSKDIWESVSAFANTEGGIIVLGISERNGFSPVPEFDVNKVCDQFVSGMGDGGTRGKLANPPRYSLERVLVADECALVIEIQELDPSLKPCYLVDRGVQGGSYKRIDDKDIMLSASEIFSISRSDKVDDSDRAPVDAASISDLNRDLIELTFSRAQILAPRSLRGADSTEDRMRRLNFIDSQGRVTKAGLLTVGEYPQQFFPKLVVDVAVHAGTTKGSYGSLKFLDRAICEGTAGEMIGAAFSAVARNLKNRSEVRGAGRVDELELPEDVVREAIANAVVHRDYSARFDGVSVSVDIYDDRVEITNPGGLYGGKTRHNLSDGSSCCRNSTLMRLMSLVPLPDGAGSPAEGNGSGIPMMMNEMEKRGLALPEFYPSFDRFKVILRRTGDDRARDESIKRGEAFVRDLLEKYGEMSVRELEEKTGLSVSQVRNRLRKLLASKEIEATAPETSHGRKYRIIGR